MSFHEKLSSSARDFIARPHRMLIGGEWVESASGKRTDIIDPGNGEAFATAAEGDASDVDRAVAAARRTFEGAWGQTKPNQRARLMFRLADLVEEHADELAQLESINSGKPLSFCRNVDVPNVAEMIRYMGGWATKITGQSPQLSLPGEWAAYTIREAVGVVGQILPWNFPLNLFSWKIAPALASGCTIVLKPAEQTPLSALRMAELILEAGFPEGVINIVTGYGDPVGAAIARHPDIDKISFTGSTATGKRIVQDATGNLKRVTLELGGKSPFIVFPDADLDMAAAGAARAIFFHAGQVCSAGSRLFAHEAIHDDLVDRIGVIARKMKVGYSLDDGNDLGPVISERQLQRVTSYLEAGLEQGAKVHTGGNRIGDKGYFVEPTILTGTRPGMSVVDEEIFGPVLSTQTFRDEDVDALAVRANATSYGLSASIWTNDLRTAHRMARRIRSGAVGVNVHSAGDATLPYGGFKQSGWGRERAFDAIETYTEVKAVTLNLN
ncbi:MAG: aldehyde dehydrogenase family protein [Sphingobium sp.]|nr:aldehyde dehydrogenase family protein [Sphingobium sp.]